MAGAPLSIASIRATPPKLNGTPSGLSSSAIVVRRGSVSVARFWLTGAKRPHAVPCPDSDRVNFCSIGVGSAVGVVRFLAPWRDYRGREVPPGTYRLRYAIQPRLKDHIGTTVFRDFLLIEPRPGAHGHPFVMAMVPAGSTSGPPRLAESTIEVDIAGVRAGLAFEGTGNLEP
jgi:hypothetical protein